MQNYSSILARLNESKEVKAPVNEALQVGVGKVKSIPKDLINKLYDDYEADILIYGVDEEVPTPWDAIFSIKGSNLVIDGFIGPNGVGKCTVEVPLDSADKFYEIEIDCPSDKHEELKGLLAEHGFTVK